MTERDDECQQIARELRNSVTCTGPQYGEHGRFEFYMFTDGVTGTTFAAKTIHEAKIRLVNIRKQFGATPPVWTKGLAAGESTASETEKWQAMMNSIRKAAKILNYDLTEEEMPEPLDWKAGSHLHERLWAEVYKSHRMYRPYESKRQKTYTKEAPGESKDNPGKFEDLPLVYHGFEPSYEQTPTLYVTQDESMARTHGSRVMVGRVLPGKLMPDPEYEGFEGRSLTGIESLNLGSAIVPIEFFWPDNEVGRQLYEARIRMLESGNHLPGNPNPTDLRSDYEEVAHVEGGTLYRKGTITQVWWDKQGKETWTSFNEEQSKENFNTMKERWSPSKPAPTGTCYPDAWRYVMRHTEGVLAHGTAISLGKRLGHAWVELPDGTVWEPSSQAIFPIERFYELVDPIVEDRYTADEAAHMVSVGKHGPWTAEEREKHIGR